MSWFGRPSRKEPPQVDDPLAALIEAEQIEAPAPTALRMRVLERARATPAMRWRVRPSRFWLRARAAVAAAIVFALGVVAAAAWRMVDQRAGVRVGDSAPASMPTRRPEAPMAMAPEEPTATANENRSPPPRRSPAPPRRVAPAAPAAEIGMLETARAAIERGAFAPALAALGEHARRFPTGHLAEEREALRIRALTGLGRRTEARRAAEAFRARFPHSFLLPRVDELVPARN